MLSDQSWGNEAGLIILLSEVLGEERLNSSLVTRGWRGRHLMVRERRFLAEVEEFYICTVEIVKKVCTCQNTLNYPPPTRMRIITHTFTSVQLISESVHSWKFKHLHVFADAQSCSTLCDPIDCRPPGSSVHGDSPGKNPRVDGHALLQGIFLTQGSNPGVPHCRQILYILNQRNQVQTKIVNTTNKR